MVAVDLAFTWWCRAGRLLCVLEFASVVVLNLLFDLVWVVGVWAGLFLVCCVGGVIVWCVVLGVVVFTLGLLSVSMFSVC